MFVILTAIAMLFYPGGTTADPDAPRYLFHQNFFSDLGLTVAKSGESNTISAVLFTAALSLAGGVLALFFTAFAQFFGGSFWSSPASRLGAVAGVISGICFVGIAATPANLHGWAHGVFVDWAFRMFLLAALLYTGAILTDRRYPKRMAIVFAAFAILLAAYVVLITVGPSTETESGLTIQATGQKIIVYAAIVAIFIQAWAALRFSRSIQAFGR
ncbi:MAG: hypothetical protein QUS33_04945 [Dehalococcoidia bacterium]|nr:hypothetical protein [Dehalococcoidia bacterium]